MSDAIEVCKALADAFASSKSMVLRVTTQMRQRVADALRSVIADAERWRKYEQAQRDALRIESAGAAADTSPIPRNAAARAEDAPQPVHGGGTALATHAEPPAIEDAPRSFDRLRERMSPEAQERAATKTQAIVAEDAPGEYMCPNCVTPWKCNGPHILPEDAPRPSEWRCTCGVTAPPCPIHFPRRNEPSTTA